jgi:Sec7-like guanine-nucleotide exchange factor
MGRYYSGDIQGKFWFAVQSSDDASAFGGEESYYNFDGDEVDEDSEELAEIGYRFTTEHLEDINAVLEECHADLADHKKILDEFFQTTESYNMAEIKSLLGVETEGLARGILRVYTRIDLGEKIKECVERTGECNFTAEC